MKRLSCLAVIGFLMLGFVPVQAQAQGHWAYVGTETGGKIGWLDPSWPDEFSGPFLECRKPGETVSLVVPMEGARPGQTAPIRFSNGTEAIEITGSVENPEFSVGDPEYIGATLGPSHQLYGLLKGKGKLTLQVGNRPKETYSLNSASAAFAKFAAACRISSRAAAPPAGSTGNGKPLSKRLSAEECTRRWLRAEGDDNARQQEIFAPCRKMIVCPASIQCEMVKSSLPFYAEKDRLLALCPSLAADSELVEKHRIYWGSTRRLIGEYCHS